MNVLETDAQARLGHALQSALTEHNGLKVMETAIVIQNLVNPIALRLIDASIFTRGPDLVKELAGIRAVDETREIVIADAERKVPLLNTLSYEFSSIYQQAFKANTAVTEIQVRVFDSGLLGHPRHADDITLISNSGDQQITTVSTSMPIRLPSPSLRFVMHTSDQDVEQTGIGSVAIFGPLVQHTTPYQPISNDVIWLTGLTLLTYQPKLESAR